MDVTPSIAAEADFQEILEFMNGDFLDNESLNEALQVNKEDCRELFGFLIRKGVGSGTSVLLRNHRGTIIGLRLSAFLDRSAEEEQDENEENLQFSAKALLVEGLLARLGEGRWDRIPHDVSRVFYVMVISVHSSCTRKGLGKVLLEYGNDRAREAGATAILAEATAIKSQALFAKHGYSVLHEVRHEDHLDKDGKRIFTCPDGTNCAQLVFKRL